jgi:hypothetical protein
MPSRLEIYAAPGIADSDLCARSGLNATKPFVSIFSLNSDILGDFYRSLLGEDSVRFESDTQTCFTLAAGYELVIQRIAQDSAFAPLCGTQSFSIPRSASEVSRLVECVGFEPISPASDGDWPELVATLADPDGNMIHLVDVEVARATAG